MLSLGGYTMTMYAVKFQYLDRANPAGNIMYGVGTPQGEGLHREWEVYFQGISPEMLARRLNQGTAPDTTLATLRPQILADDGALLLQYVWDASVIPDAAQVTQPRRARANIRPLDASDIDRLTAAVQQELSGD